MTKKKRNKKFNYIYPILLLVVIVLAITGYFLYEHYKEPKLESLSVFGQEIPIVKGKHAYELNLEGGEIKGCFVPVEFDSNIEGNIYQTSGGENGDNYLEAYFSFDDSVSGEIEQGNVWDYSVKVSFEKPLKLNKICESENGYTMDENGNVYSNSEK